MAIYGVGSYYDPDDMTQAFLDRSVAAVGYSEKEAPVFHAILNRLQTGDIVYMKSFPPNQGLIIKAVGIVNRARPRHPDARDDKVGSFISVDWVWRGNEVVGRIEDKYTARSLSLYEELNPEVQELVVRLLKSMLNRR
ncbi:MAG TPA: hypothetical protein VM889_01795 [Candidatus Thermoplasmatota archaeon]|jgi:hypothetical protein|nr:hypothetical protein [Candidatus Thermoplasmatota archaeon]